MAKGKRKKTALPSHERNLLRAYNYKDLTVEGYRAFFKEKRGIYGEIAQQIGLGSKPSEEPAYTAYGQEVIYAVRDSENEFDATTLIRDVILGYWMNHKIVYHIQPETMDFIENTFRIELLQIPLDSLLKTICEEPIYIELNDGANRQAMFVGSTPIIRDTLFDGHRVMFTLVSFALDAHEDDCYIRLIGSLAGKTVQEHMRQMHDKEVKDGDAPSQAYLRLLKVLLYIAYVLRMQDCMGNVLVHDTAKAYKCFKVKPIPFLDSIPDLSVKGGWIAAGLCHVCGYLDRNRMRTDFQGAVSSFGTTRNHVFRSEDGNIAVSDIEQFAKRMVLDWEDEKTVYQYTDEVEEKLWNKYIEEFCLHGYTVDMLRYMPQSTVILNNTDSGSISLLSLCNLKIDEGTAKPSIAICEVGKENLGFCLMQASAPGSPMFGITMSKEGPDHDSEIAKAILLYHILWVYQQKALKREQRALTSGGLSEDSNALVPVKVRSSSPHDESDLRAVVQGYDIEELPTIFDITPRTVKLVPAQKVQEQSGWKMRPHTRRAHPHHYWVGHGENKHRVVRQLESIRVNHAAGAYIPTTTHEII